MPTTAVQILDDTKSSLKVAGYGVVFGGSDVVGDFFSPSTDFWADDASKNPPVLYQHGQDESLKRTRVGKVTNVHADDVGLWVEAQLTASSKYLDAIRQLVSKGVLGWSSGSVGHLVDRVKHADGRKEITSWPIFEFSLTPTPAEPRTIGVRAMKALGLESFVDDYDTVEDGTKAQQGLSASDYGFVDSDGTGHLDISDEGHVRAAMARFNQTHFPDAATRRSAARKILARARSMGIQVDPDSTVADAAKGAILNDLPDDAFGYVEPGTLDDEAKTFPRANRHFPHHDANGELDQSLLAEAIKQARADHTHGGRALAHLVAHARNEPDAHTKYFAEDSLLGIVLTVIDGLDGVIEPILAEEKAAELFGQTHPEWRAREVLTQRLLELKSVFDVAIARAIQAETGDDGAARADHLRRQLALLEI